MELIIMHELGVLCQIAKTVNRVAEENQIKHVKHVTLEVGEESGYLPYFLEKLFPVAIEYFPRVEKAQLKLLSVPGRGLQIKDIGY